MNIGDVGGETASQTALAQLSNGAGSASQRGILGPVSSSELQTTKVFTDKAVRAFNDLRIKGQLCDAVIRAGDTSFLVHRNIMSAGSAYFRALFTSRGFPNEDLLRQPQEVLVSDVPPEILGCLIDYAYSCQVVITEDNVLDVFKAADRCLACAGG